MTIHSFYFVFYAVIATFVAAMMAHGYYIRYKREGVPANYTLIALVAGVALAMWTGASVMEHVYEPTATTAGLARFFLGVWLSVGAAAPVYVFMRKQRAFVS
ncbi:MAG: hypothetical protein HY804_13385 [Nitrospinae bacterium]|nr:hypothetical protein [Nitrospinota bacterium]